jgi:hypothetical protein
LAIPLMYSHAGYIWHANTQLHHQMKLHIYLNSGSSKCGYILLETQILSIRTWNKCGFSFPAGDSQMCLVYCEGWHGNATFEQMTYCFTLSPNVLSWVQLQESGPSLKNPSQTLPSPVLSQITPLTVVTTTGLGSTIPQGRAWNGWGKWNIMVTLTTAHHSRVTSPFPETHPRTSSPSIWALWPQRTQPYITVLNTVSRLQC